MSPGFTRPDEMKGKPIAWKDAIRILATAQNNVGIGTSAGQRIQSAISDLETDPTPESAVELLARRVSELGESLEATKQQVKTETDARKGANTIAVFAILATILAGVPPYLPYLGRDPDNDFQGDLLEAVSEIQQAIVGIRPPVIDCNLKASPVIPGSRPLSK
jgi:hypothetical protein